MNWDLNGREWGLATTIFIYICIQAEQRQNSTDLVIKVNRSIKLQNLGWKWLHSVCLLEQLPERKPGHTIEDA
jgi:hypothetical protein